MEHKVLTWVLCCLLSCLAGYAQRSKPAPSDTKVTQMEKLDRGLVVLPTSSTTSFFVSWRLFGTDDENTTFEILKNGVSVAKDIFKTTSMKVSGKKTDEFQIVTYQNGLPVSTSEKVTPWSSPFLKLPLERPANGAKGGTYSPNDCSVGDVDGDGQYEIILEWDPSNSRDNSNTGYSDPVIFDCYKLNGTRLWRLDLGVNIRAGAHYTQFLVYDFDKDGKAEMICKTAPGSKDANGDYVTAAATLDEIKNADNTQDYRDTGSDKKNGHVLAGPEYLTVFNGETGKAMHTIFYNPNRAGEFNKTSAYPSDKNFWNDDYGNRSDRFLACVAYLDGSDKNPSAVMCRGYYTKAYFWAVDWTGTELKHKWLHASISKTQVDVYDANWNKTTKTYNNNTADISYSYTAWGNGNHNISVADVDGDGKDEVLYGSAAVDDDGQLLYAVGFGHGDAIHLADLDPDRPGYEIFDVHEESHGSYGCDIHDAMTGEILHRATRDRDTGRGLAADFDSRYRGCEFTYATQLSSYKINGIAFAESNPGMNFRIFWDGDEYEELLDDTGVSKWNEGNIKQLSLVSGKVSGAPKSCNGTKATPCLSADIFGDWREEIIFWSEANELSLVIYSTITATTYRVPTLMHDHVYRMGICWQNVAYNQPPHLGYYLPDYVESFQGKEATGIQEIEISDEEVAGRIYNLQGIPVEKPTKGIYLMNGKKAYIK